MGSSVGAGSATLTACVQQGQRYYVVLERSSASDFVQAERCLSYSYFSISTPSAPLGRVTVNNLPYSEGAGGTCGLGNKITSITTPSCGTASEGEDKIWTFTPAASGVIEVRLNGVSGGHSVRRLALYQGGTLGACVESGIAGATCIAHTSVGDGDNYLCATVQAGQTYHLVLDWNRGCGTYTIAMHRKSPVNTLNTACMSTVPGYSESPEGKVLRWEAVAYKHLLDRDRSVAHSPPSYPKGEHVKLTVRFLLKEHNCQPAGRFEGERSRSLAAKWLMFRKRRGY